MWAIPIQTKHPVEAWEFIKFLNGPIGQTIRFNYNGDLSVLKSVVKKEVIDTNIISENGDVITESLKYSYVPYAGVVKGVKIVDIVKPDLDLLMLGKQDAKRGMY